MDDLDPLIDALHSCFISPNVADSNLEAANLVDVIQNVARALHNLGNSDAATRMGAIEAHGKAVYDGAELIAGAINNLAEAIRERE